jgi:predicted secreted protein
VYGLSGKTMNIEKRTILITAALLALGFTYFVVSSVSSRLSSDGVLQDLTSVEILQTQFNADSDKVRMVLLLSPT